MAVSPQTEESGETHRRQWGEPTFRGTDTRTSGFRAGFARGAGLLWPDHEIIVSVCPSRSALLEDIAPDPPNVVRHLLLSDLPRALGCCAEIFGRPPSASP